MYGARTKPISDTSEGIDVSWRDDNDWFVYHLEIRALGGDILDLFIAHLSSSGADGGHGMAPVRFFHFFYKRVVEPTEVTDPSGTIASRIYSPSVHQ
jgi:hypothetical protein